MPKTGDPRARLKNNFFFKPPHLKVLNPNPKIGDCDKKTKAITELANYAFDVFVVCIGITITLNFINSCLSEESLKSSFELGILFFIILGAWGKLNEGEVRHKSKEVIEKAKCYLNSKRTINLEGENLGHFYSEIGLEKNEYGLLLHEIENLNTKLDLLRSSVNQWNLKTSLDKIAVVMAKIKMYERIKSNINEAFRLYSFGVDKYVTYGKLDTLSRVTLNKLRFEYEDNQLQEVSSQQNLLDRVNSMEFNSSEKEIELPKRDFFHDINSLPRTF